MQDTSKLRDTRLLLDIEDVITALSEIVGKSVGATSNNSLILKQEETFEENICIKVFRNTVSIPNRGRAPQSTLISV